VLYQDTSQGAQEQEAGEIGPDEVVVMRQPWSSVAEGTLRRFGARE
jgi:hypothetical protein